MIEAARIALVTGGSRGIGRAIALALVDVGYAVAVNYRSRAAEAQAVVDEITARGGRALPVAGDVADPEQAKAIVRRTINELGGLHVLVNNAGVVRNRLVFDMAPDDWRAVMDVNFGGVFNCTLAAIDHFAVQRDGAIVNVSSVMGDRGWIGQANYAASKAAVNAFTRCCGLEFSRFGVRVNAVLPGLTDTELVADLFKQDGAQGILRQIPMGRFPGAEEVASAVVFLAGPASGGMTGAFITVDGGASSLLGVGKPLK